MGQIKVKGKMQRVQTEVGQKEAPVHRQEPPYTTLIGCRGIVAAGREEITEIAPLVIGEIVGGQG